MVATLENTTILVAPDYGPDPATYVAEGKTVGVYGGKFFPPHRGHLGFALHAASMVDVLFVAVQYDEEHEKQLCEGTGFTPIPPQLRAAWLTEEFRDYPNIRVLAQYEKRTSEHLTDPALGATYRDLEAAVGGRIHRIFSNTHEYTDYFKAWLPDAEHVVIEGRPVVPISASEIREAGVEATWEYLPEVVQRHYQKRVVLAGWESSGKSYTARSVAKTLGGCYLPEYGREYYEKRGGYTSVVQPTDFLNIAAGHLQQLENAPTQNKLLVLDTDLIYTQFYYLEAYGELNPGLDDIIRRDAERVTKVIFLEPWNRLVQDGSRFELAAEERKATSERLKALYAYYGRELVVVDEPDPAARMLKAVELAVASASPTVSGSTNPHDGVFAKQ